MTGPRPQGGATAVFNAVRLSRALGIALLVALTGCGTLAAPAQPPTGRAAAPGTALPAQQSAERTEDRPAAMGSQIAQLSAHPQPTMASGPAVPAEPVQNDEPVVVQGATRFEPPPAEVPAPSALMPDRAPAAAVADNEPVPRVEAPRPGSNRPYMVKGRQYVPQATLIDHSERGLASWYGHAFHGRPTASGERFDMHGLTAAHKTLPIPSTIRVTHVRSGRSVVVRVNDRGPFSGERVLDLSYAAAQRLGFAHQGTAEVQIELLAAPAGLSLAARTGRRGELASASGAPTAGPLAAAVPVATATAALFAASQPATAGLATAPPDQQSPEGDVAP